MTFSIPNEYKSSLNRSVRLKDGNLTGTISPSPEVVAKLEPYYHMQFSITPRIPPFLRERGRERLRERSIFLLRMQSGYSKPHGESESNYELNENDSKSLDVMEIIKNHTRTYRNTHTHTHTHKPTYARG